MGQGYSRSIPTWSSNFIGPELTSFKHLPTWSNQHEGVRTNLIQLHLHRTEQPVGFRFIIPEGHHILCRNLVRSLHSQPRRHKTGSSGHLPWGTAVREGNVRCGRGAFSLGNALLESSFSDDMRQFSNPLPLSRWHRSNRALPWPRHIAFAEIIDR